MYRSLIQFLYFVSGSYFRVFSDEIVWYELNWASRLVLYLEFSTIIHFFMSVVAWVVPHEAAVLFTAPRQ
jgi:hypothetical protein